MEECCLIWNAIYNKLLMVITQSNNIEDYEKSSDEAAAIWKALKETKDVIKHLKDHEIKRDELNIINMLDKVIKMNKEIENYQN